MHPIWIGPDPAPGDELWLPLPREGLKSDVFEIDEGLRLAVETANTGRVLKPELGVGSRRRRRNPLR